MRAAASERPYDALLRRFHRRVLLDALRAEEGHAQRAAKRLGMHRNTFSALARQAGIRMWEVKRLLRDEGAAHKGRLAAA